jgi:hypothetical protein
MQVIGTNVRRVDGVEKVSGQGLYADDLRLPGTCYAKVLRSALPHARIRRIEAGKAAVLPGIVALLTRDNLNVAANSFGVYVKDQQILATDKVRYAGDMVAAVAAIDESVAEEALELIDVEYEELPAVYTRSWKGAKIPIMDGAVLTSSTSAAISVFIFVTTVATLTKDFGRQILSLRIHFRFPALSTIPWSPMFASRSSTARFCISGLRPKVRSRCDRNWRAFSAFLLALCA